MARFVDGVVEGLRDAGAILRSDIVEGSGGRQVLPEDPSGNPVELMLTMTGALVVARN
jgi:hypothetical protein